MLLGKQLGVANAFAARELNGSSREGLIHRLPAIGYSRIAPAIRDAFDVFRNEIKFEV
jgi:hypothetical protein